MQILLANAKLLHKKVHTPAWSTPLFQQTANRIATEMAACPIDTLAEQLDCSHALAAENWKRYQNFFTAASMPAVLAYNGMAYKHLQANELDDEALRFAQEHLWITCFLYGLLRPMDSIVPYRMEHTVHLPVTEGRAIGHFWKPLLTDFLIKQVQADDGVLLHLSTAEYEQLFDWKRVCQSVRVVQPLFYVHQPNGKLKMQAVWAKACRGAMTRFVIEQRITAPRQLQDFIHAGFTFAPAYGEPDFPHFIRQDA
ncbi:MAG: YaaA family protein [Alloprevotella sp.]